MEFLAILVLAALCIWWLMRVRARSRRDREVNRELVLRLIEMNERIKRLEGTHLGNPKSLSGRRGYYLLESSKAKADNAERAQPGPGPVENSTSADLQNSTVDDSIHHPATPTPSKPPLADSRDIRGGKTQSLDKLPKVGLAILVVTGALSIARQVKWLGKSSNEE